MHPPWSMIFFTTLAGAAQGLVLMLVGIDIGASLGLLTPAPATSFYIVGAVLMGFGGMLAGGCAVGAGLSGAAVFTATSWVTLIAMWASAALTDRLIDQQPTGLLDQTMPGAAVGAR